MSLATRTQALLDLVEQERVRQCEALLGQARTQAAALREASRAEARQHVRQAFAEERTRAQARSAAARAALRTRQRVHAQHHLEALLALAWQRLPEVLAARWRDGAARRAWVDAAMATARQRFGPGPWQVIHAPGWPEAERAACETAGALLHFACDGQLGAGLRIAAAGNVVDASLPGLLADRDEVGGRLVGRLEGPAGGLP